MIVTPANSHNQASKSTNTMFSYACDTISQKKLDFSEHESDQSNHKDTISPNILDFSEKKSDQSNHEASFHTANNQQNKNTISTHPK